LDIRNPVPADALPGLAEKVTKTVLLRKASFMAHTSNEGMTKSIADIIINQLQFMVQSSFFLYITRASVGGETPYFADPLHARVISL